MPENVVRVSLSELTTFRVRCMQCKQAVVEVVLEHLGDVLTQDLRCRFCNAVLFSTDHLAQLKSALEALAKRKDKVSVDFDLPARTTP